MKGKYLDQNACSCSYIRTSCIPIPKYSLIDSRHTTCCVSISKWRNWILRNKQLKWNGMSSSRQREFSWNLIKCGDFGVPWLIRIDRSNLTRWLLRITGVSSASRKVFNVYRERFLWLNSQNENKWSKQLSKLWTSYQVLQNGWKLTMRICASDFWKAWVLFTSNVMASTVASSFKSR